MLVGEDGSVFVGDKWLEALQRAMIITVTLLMSLMIGCSMKSGCPHV